MWHTVGTVSLVLLHAAIDHVSKDNSGSDTQSTTTTPKSEARVLCSTQVCWHHPTEPLILHESPPFPRLRKTRPTNSNATEAISEKSNKMWLDEAHLDTTVKKLGLIVPGKVYPQWRDLTADGEFVFTMVLLFLDTPYKIWADERRVKKYETFFGAEVSAEVLKIHAEQRLVGKSKK
jgi:Protein of unknown function (DUF2854)